MEISPDPIAITTAGLLVSIGLLHIYWAAGGTWGSGVTVPEVDGKPLFNPGPLPTLAVAFLLFASGVLLLGRSGFWGTSLPTWPFRYGTWALVAAFTGR